MSLSKEKNYLLCLLAKKDYSRKQLYDKLHDRANISTDEIKSLIGELEKSKLLSDERLAYSFVLSEIAKFRGKKRITNAAVYQKGLSYELVDNVLRQLDTDWFKLCQQSLGKKYKDLAKIQADFKLKQKAIKYLIYNGFSSDEIKFAINGQLCDLKRFFLARLIICKFLL